VILLVNNAFAQKIPGCKAIDADKKIFLDRHEITVLDWGEFCVGQGQLYGATSPQTLASLPDSATFAQTYGLCFYFIKDSVITIRPAKDVTAMKSLLSPMTGISYEQALAYCQWRSKVVNEKFKRDNKKYSVTYSLPSKEDYILASKTAPQSNQPTLTKIKYKSKKMTGLFDNVSEYTNDKNTIIDGYSIDNQSIISENALIGFRCKATINCSYAIYTLNDITKEGNANILISPDIDTLKKYIPDGTYPSAINAFLVQINDSNFLFDAGLGTKLVENLATYKVKPQNVHKIFITHCHGDHIGGLLKEGSVVFPNAVLYVNRVEYDYWLKEKNPLFLQVIEKYKSQLQLFDIEDVTKNKLLHTNIQAIAAYGHTPGHTMYLIGNKGNETLIWGDLTHVMPIQMPHPEYSVSYDVDPAQAAKTRENVLYFIDTEYITNIAGMHIPNGQGYIKTDGQGYRFVEKEKR
jgi:glyoxylase-like metal-dependent hydrolase (beta-lactamase superfamily II)